MDPGSSSPYRHFIHDSYYALLESKIKVRYVTRTRSYCAENRERRNDHEAAADPLLDLLSLSPFSMTRVTYVLLYIISYFITAADSDDPRPHESISRRSGGHMVMMRCSGRKLSGLWHYFVELCS